MILGFIGSTELLLIGGLALLLFGGKKLPEMMRGLGKGVKEFKSGLKDEDPQEPMVNQEPMAVDEPAAIDSAPENIENGDQQ